MQARLSVKSVAVSTLIVLAVLSAAACSSRAPKTAAPSATATAAATGLAPNGDLLAEVRQRGFLIIATDANYSPQSVLNTDGSWSGFDVDVGRQIAQRLGVRPVFKAANFDLLVRGHWPGKWDINVGSMAITEDRAKVLWFSKSYYWVPGSIAVKTTSSINSLSGLAGKNVGVTAATTFQSFLQGKLSGKVNMKALHVRVVPYDTDSHALNDLKQGNGRAIDAVLTSLPTIQTAIHHGLPIRIVGTPVFEDRSAIALDRSGDASQLSLLFAIDGIIDAMRRDGTLRRLSMKYYGMDLSNG
jgi:polar amino acid transport system substrate-binding protein